MKSLPVSRFMAAVSATALLASSVAAAQMSVQKVAATNKVLQQVKSSIKKLSPSHRMAPTSILRRPTIAEKIIREGPLSSLCSRMTAV